MAEPLAAGRFASNSPRITRAASQVPPSPIGMHTEPPAPEESEDGLAMSAAKKVGSMALSGISMLGNLLDVVPSMARDVLSGENPFDQLLSPLSHANVGKSATGRDMLAKNILTSWLFTPNKETGIGGWVDDPLEGVQDVLGFAAEMASGGFIRAPGAVVRGLRGGSKVAAPTARAAGGVVDDAARAAGSAVDDVARAAGDDLGLGSAAGVWRSPQGDVPLHGSGGVWKKAADDLASPSSPPRPPNQIDDPILHLASEPAPLAGGIRGRLDRFGDTLTKYDPGTYVGRGIDKAIGNLSEKYSLPQLFDQEVTQRFLKTRFGKSVQAYQDSRAASSPPKITQSASGKGRPTVTGMTEQMELSSMMASGSAARGSRLVTDLNQDQDLATRLGSAFGAQVLFWGGGKSPSRAWGLRRSDIGNRIWVNEEAPASIYNSIMGHELAHLLRDVDTKAFDRVVEIIQQNAPSDTIAKNAAEYMKNSTRSLLAGMQFEEGVTTTVEKAFDRPSFWEDLVSDPKIEASVQKAFTQTMDKLKSQGILTAQEFEVLDKELSTFIFGQADAVRGGATEASLKASRAGRFHPDVVTNPLADAFAAPASRTHRVIKNVEDLSSRISAGIQAAMNYKVGGHTYPVVQAFSKDKTDLYESMVTDVTLPSISAAETVSKLVDDLGPDLSELDKFTIVKGHEDAIVRAVETGRYSDLHPQLHPAVKQIELAQTALKERGIRAGQKLDELHDDYVKYFRHELHPAIQEKMRSLDSLSSNMPGADLAVANKSNDSGRTTLFRNAHGGRATWNAATSDPSVLNALKDKTIGRPEIRVEAAAQKLQDTYLSDIDPRIPVMRDDNFVMLQRMPDGTLTPHNFSMKEMKALERVPSQHDLTTEAGRLAEHSNEPIVYIAKSVDETGAAIITEFEQLTGRLPGDTRYGDIRAVTPEGKIDKAAFGFYNSMDEGQDRFRALSNWMKKIGTDTLEETGGVFSGSALENWTTSMQSKVNSLAAAEALPQFLAAGIRSGVITQSIGDANMVGDELRLSKIFDTPYFSVVNRNAVYNKLASIDPHLQGLAATMNQKQFKQLMDDMVITKEIMDDLKLAGTYMQKMPAIDNVLKLGQSMNSMWKSGVLTHPGFHNRNLASGLAQLVQGNLYSNTAAAVAYKAMFNQPAEELLHYGAVKNYLNRFGMDHTPENATRAVRVLFGNFMRQSGNMYQDYTDAAAPVGDAARGLESLLSPLPGDGRQNPLDMLKGSARTLIGREGDTTFNPFDVAGVQHVFEKTDDTGRVTAKAGDVRAENSFSPVAASDIVGKHVNDYTRLAGFVEGLRRGDAPVDAWKAVDFNQLNYNPRTYGPLEQKVLKKIFPFYSFMSRETAWIARELLTNPTGRLGKTIQLIRHSQPTNDFLPEHISEGTAIPLGGEDSTGTQDYLTGFGLMFEDPVKMLMPTSSTDITRDLLSKTNPLIKAPIEWGTGRSSFQGGPLGGRDLADMDPVLGRIFTQLGLQEERSGGQAAPAFGSRSLEFALSNSPASRILSSVKTGLDDRKNVLERSMNILTGLRITSVSPEQKQRGIRELTNAISKDLGARPFTTFHVSQELLDEAQQNDPEKYATLLRIKAMRKEWDKQQRIKRKERAAEAQAQ